MFGSQASGHEDNSPVTAQKPATITTSNDIKNSGEKRMSASISPARKEDDCTPTTEKKRRSGSVSKAREILSNAKQSLHLRGLSPPMRQISAMDRVSQPSTQELDKSDPALTVPQGPLNNSAGESVPGPSSTFKVGVTEDKNKKCRRTMEDTHAYLYNFVGTPSPRPNLDGASKSRISVSSTSSDTSSDRVVMETDNGYFSIFDGHAGSFAADWCGKKLHILLEENVRKNPSTPLPELLDQTFTSVDQQLEKLPLKNSGCTAVIAVLRWENRIPSSLPSVGSRSVASAIDTTPRAASEPPMNSAVANGSSGTCSRSVCTSSNQVEVDSKPKDVTCRQRVLYTANVGDARVVLCRNGRALRLSYDHKASDENEGKRVSKAGGLILNNRVNGVLAVTRALGDAYIKPLVIGHPYTTETPILPDQDEFLILACDGLWDVCSDQEAVDLVRHMKDPQDASKKLVDHALSRFSTDNVSCMIVLFDNDALKQRKMESSVGVDGDYSNLGKEGITEVEAIISRAKKAFHVDEGTES